MKRGKSSRRFKNKYKDIGYENFYDTEIAHSFEFERIFSDRMRRASHSHQRSVFRPELKNSPED